MGSVPNCQKEIADCYPIRWFKCKLKPPKNQGRPQSISGKYCSRSSVVIEEMEMQTQPMMGPAITRTLNAPRVHPPALEAPKPISKESIAEEGIPVTPETVAWALETNAGLDFKKFYNKEGQTKRTSLPPAINKHMKHDITLHYVLCSSHFEDMVLIHPSNIDTCELNSNYETPRINTVRNQYFKTRRKEQRKSAQKNHERLKLELSPK